MLLTPYWFSSGGIKGGTKNVKREEMMGNIHRNLLISIL